MGTGVGLLAATALSLVPTAATAMPGNGPHLQPGMKIEMTWRENSCTAGFMLRGSDGRGYLIASGLCASYKFGRWPLEPNVNRSFPRGKGPLVWIAATDARVGRVRYAYAQTPFGGDMYDFSIVELDRGVRADPNVLGLGRPTRVYDDVNMIPTIVEISGAGSPTIWTEGPQNRSGPLPYGPNSATVVYAEIGWNSDDAGAPTMIADKEALGLFGGYFATEGGAVGTFVPRAGTPVARLGPMLAQASRVLKVKLRLL